MSRTAGYDRHISVFSPEGRLYQVEYAIKASKSLGLNIVAARSSHGVVIASQKTHPEKLADSSYQSSIYAISTDVCMAVSGILPDGFALVQRARQIAAKFADKNGYTIPPKVLAMKLADMAQVYTQHAYMRPYASTVLVVGCEETVQASAAPQGGQLYKIDPSGHYAGFKAVAIGSKEQEAGNLLEKKLAAGGPLGSGSLDQAAFIALETLQTTLGGSVRAKDVEVVVVGANGVKRMSEEEIEELLVEIAERD